jgi:anti-anti-sigma factor
MTDDAFSPRTVAFHLRREGVGGMVRVTVLGELDLQTEPVLVAEVDAALAAGPAGRVVVDLTGVQFMDSSGLRALLMCRDRARAAGSTLLLAVETGPVTALLDMAGVGDWFGYE